MTADASWQAPAIRFDFNEHMALVILIRDRRQFLRETNVAGMAEHKKRAMEYEEQFLHQIARKLELAGQVNKHLLEAKTLTRMLEGGVLEDPEPS